MHHKQWIKQEQLKKQQARIDSGGVVCKSRKLHVVKSLYVSSGAPLTEPADIADATAQVFARRWGAHNLQERDNVHDFLRAAEFAQPSLSVDDLRHSFRVLRRKQQLDGDGICIALLEAIFEAEPFVFLDWIKRMVSCSPFMASLHARCSVFGKKSCHPHTDARCGTNERTFMHY